MCILQATAHTSGAIRSVELAAIGRRVCENEWDLLADAPDVEQRDEPHDMPDAAALVEAVREFLERDVMAATEGRVQFHARVAVNVLGMVEREITLGARSACRARARGWPGSASAASADLADAIRSGALDDRVDEVREFVTRDRCDRSSRSPTRST